jgi:membrane fusion protein (multidrug efflux system)
MKFACVVLALVLAVGCQDKKKKEDVTATNRLVPVEVVDVRVGPIRDTLTSTSTVDSRLSVDIVAEIPGIVVGLDVEQGDTVKQNARLAQIQRAELGLGVDTAKSSVNRLESEVDRLKPLFDKGVVSRQMFDESVWRLEQAKSEQRRANTAAADQRVTSPMDGVVAVRTVNVGQQVAMGTPLFRVVDPADLVVFVNLPETALGRVFEGQKTYVESEALASKQFDGTVERISPVVDPRTGTVRVTIGVASQDEGLRPGMFVKVNIVIEEKSDALIIPRRSVVYVEDEATVFTVAKGLAERRSVSLGVSEGAEIQVLSGLKAGEPVVVLGQDGLKNGTPVDPSKRKDTL